MAVKVFDEINLQKIGLSQRNIVALRNISDVVAYASLDTTDIEKYTFSLEDFSEDLVKGLNNVREMVLLRQEINRIGELEGPEIQKLSTIYELLTRIEGLEERLETVVVKDPTTGYEMTVNQDGRGDVVQHAHPDSGYIHVDYDVTGGTDVDFIAIDLSDTTNYPHSNTGSIHIEEIYVAVDAEVNADYMVEFGFLANVGAVDGDYYEIMHVNGNKTVGQQQEVVRKFYPNGPRCLAANVASSDVTLNDTKYNTGASFLETVDMATGAKAPGDGDLVVYIYAGAGGANTNFSVEINIAYHTHP